MLFRSNKKFDATDSRNKFSWIKSGNSELVRFSRGKWECAMNFSGAALKFDTAGVVLSSEPYSEGEIPANSALWMIR